MEIIQKQRSLYLVSQPWVSFKSTHIVLDTNNIEQKDRNVSTKDTSESKHNFLEKSHKRTRKGSGRYFKDERISLPKIAQDREISNGLNMNSKRISCVNDAEKLTDTFRQTFMAQNSETDTTVKDSQGDSIINKPRSMNKVSMHHKLSQKTRNKTILSKFFSDTEKTGKSKSKRLNLQRFRKVSVTSFFIYFNPKYSFYA